MRQPRLQLRFGPSYDVPTEWGGVHDFVVKPIRSTCCGTRRVRRVTQRTSAIAIALLLPLTLSPLAAVRADVSRPETGSQPPDVLFGDLFTAVQNARVFPDGKTFVDADPQAAPAEILADYRLQHPATVEQLRQFVTGHFRLPAGPAAAALPAQPQDIVSHIDSLWNQLTRETASVPPYSSLLPLPRPYVVPGGRFRELYYWDSYFTMLGLAESGRGDLLEDMAGNFAFLIDTYGHVPNGTRTYYLSRSQPPFFYAMVGLLADTSSRASTASGPSAAAPSPPVRFLPQLQREHAFWMKGATGLARGTGSGRVVALADGAILNRYWDDADTPRAESYREDMELARASGREARQLYRDIRAAAESGWDFSSRWFGDGRTLATIDTTEIVPVDLNSLLYGLEKTIEAACRRKGDGKCAVSFERQARSRRAAMDRYLWDPLTGAYLDYRWTRGTRITRVSAATVYPLFVSAASPRQAESVARAVTRDLLQPGGILTTPLDTGQQWDAPNGWAPLQWLAVAGLRNYGQHSLARAIACRWMVAVNILYARQSRLVEKYDVMKVGRDGGGGEYPSQDGFGWTNGVYRKLAALFPRQAGRWAVQECPQP